MGAQYYARCGIPLASIQFLGRWGGATVEKYVADALSGRASWASVRAADHGGKESDPGTLAMKNEGQRNKAIKKDPMTSVRTT